MPRGKSSFDPSAMTVTDNVPRGGGVKPAAKLFLMAFRPELQQAIQRIKARREATGAADNGRGD